MDVLNAWFIGTADIPSFLPVEASSLKVTVIGDHRSLPNGTPDIVILRLDDYVAIRDMAEGAPVGPVVAIAESVDSQKILHADQHGIADCIQRGATPHEVLARIRIAAREWRRRESSPASDKGSDGHVWVAHAIAPVVRGFCHDALNALPLLRALIEYFAAQYEPSDVESRRLLGDTYDLIASTSAMVADLGRFARLLDDPRLKTPWVHAYALPVVLPQMLSGLSTDGVAITAEVIVPDAVLRMPRSLIRHLLTPLVVNSVEAISGSPPMEHATGRVDVRFRADAIEQFVELTIADNGPGWTKPGEEFERALRSNQPFSSKGHTRGNGLLNVSRIVQALGGRMRLREGREGGATVDIVIPWSVDAYI